MPKGKITRAAEYVEEAAEKTVTVGGFVVFGIIVLVIVGGIVFVSNVMGLVNQVLLSVLVGSGWFTYPQSNAALWLAQPVIIYNTIYVCTGLLNKIALWIINLLFGNTWYINNFYLTYVSGNLAAITKAILGT